MIQSLGIYCSDSFDPYYNLAIEKYLLDGLLPGECILYLWQNQNTVVIGRNQNPWKECRTTLLEEEGGKLARRLSGGGAVFHDMGNLNFTFLVNKEDYDLDKQLSVIQEACAMANIRAERSGRNDLLAEGCKFSGNAFYQDKHHAYHHGTLLIQVDMDKLQRYLSPSKAKLEAKGIQSVRSRVINLSSLAPGLTIGRMKEYMRQAFKKVYGLPYAEISLSVEDKASISLLQDEYSNWDYLYGTPLPCTLECEQHYLWGGILLQFEVSGGVIRNVRVYSDAMDWHMPKLVETALTDCRFQFSAMASSLQECAIDRQICHDIIHLLEEQSI